MSTTELEPNGPEVTLVDLADRLLGRGVVLAGDLVLSVAGVDLVYVSLRAVLASVDTAIASGWELP
ncbi:MAG TPA: gas vesicle protein [Acidimicrobiales bacterium]|nr:gas vesicle protein [Acidimicrobiales bacterium]